MIRSAKSILEALCLLLSVAAVGLIVWYLVQDEDYGVLGITAIAVSAPLIALVLSQAAAWREPYASYVSVGLIVLLTAVFRTRNIDDKSIDAQVVCKLACLAIMALLGLSAHLSRTSSFNTYTRLSFSLIFLFYMVIECVISVNPADAIVEAASNCIAALFIIGIAERLGPRKLLDIFMSACGMLCLMSFIAYFAFPQLGRMTDWVQGAYVETSRLAGVFGTPNGAGLAAAFCLLATILFRRATAMHPTHILQCLLFATVLVASNNRMGMFSIVCVLTGFCLIGRGKRLAMFVGLCVATAVALLFTIYSDSLLVALSRSGSAAEITSGTGRTQIWSVVVDLWLQKPLFGYGIASAKFILPHHPLLFEAAAHAHSLYLNVLFAGGAVGAGILAVCLCRSLYSAWSRRSYEAMALVIFFLIYGITEPIIGGIASFFSMTFGVALLLAQSGCEKLAAPVVENTLQIVHQRPSTA